MLAIYNMNKVVSKEITLLFADYLYEQGVVTAHYQEALGASYDQYLIGKAPYEVFIQAYIEGLSVVEKELLQNLGISFVKSRMSKYLAAWAREEIARCQAQGMRVLIVSPAHDVLVRPLAQCLFNQADCIASEFLSDANGHFSSAFKSPVPIGAGILERLIQWQKTCPEFYKRHELKYYGGDSMDEAILSYMGFVVVVNPQPLLEKLAWCKKESGWSVVKTA